MAKFKKKTLSNGLRVIAVPMKDNQTATVLVLVEAGSEYEDKKTNGMSHFLEHMVFKGTKSRPEPKRISFEFDSIGAESNAFTGTEYTGYYGKGHVKHLDKIFDLVSDIFLNPIFPEEEMEKEKGVIIEEINMYEDVPARKVGMVFLELLYGDQPAGRTIFGPKENIKKFKREDFVDYRKRHYVPSATTVVIAGGVSARDAFSKAEKMFGGIKSSKKDRIGKTIEKQKKPQIKISHKKSDQTHLILGVRAFSVFHKDVWAASILSTVLGRGMSSRLFAKLRDELGMCYYVGSSLGLRSNHGYLSVRAGVTNNRTKEAVGAILNEMRLLREEPVSPKELKKAKDFAIGHMYLGLETSDDLAFDYGHQEIMRLELLTPREIAKNLREVTAKDVQRVAKKIFKNEKLNLAMVGPFKDKKQFSSLLKI